MFQANLFQDKVVLVTGGGTGIGYEIAQQFLQYGAKVWIASRNEEKLQMAHNQLLNFGECYYQAVDIRQPEQVQNLAQVIAKQSGRLDILINNAGGQFMLAAEKISLNGWNSVINNNLNGTWYVTRAMADAFFIPQKSGNIINIIAQIFRGFPGMAHTGAARAGVDNLTKTLAVEWSKYSIYVNAIAPGVIHSSGLDTYPEEIRKNTLENAPKQIPLKKLGKVEDVAYLALFLASPMASFITGETVYVDGGQRLWGDMWELPDTAI
jgi:citronellol/citronellal dehydrogenase